MNIEVVAAVIVRDTKVLLVRSKKNGACVTPGGRVEPGETHAAAVVREVREETGLTVTSVGKCLGMEQRGVFAVHFYLAEVASGEPVAGDDAADAWWGHPRESKDHLWALEGMAEHLRAACQLVAAMRRGIFAEIDAERARQDTRWGETDYPMVGHAARRGLTPPRTEAARLLLPSAGSARELCDHEHRQGRGTYTSIAVEELAEFVEACVLHGETSDEARKELVQTAAVLVAMIECIDRQRVHRG